MTNTLSFSSIMMLCFALGTTACMQKNPVANLDQLRKDGRSELQGPPDGPEILVDPNGPQGTGAVDSNLIVISTDPTMTLTEGQSTTFKIRARVLRNGPRVVLTAEGLPPGATLQDASSPTEHGLFLLTWKPAMGTVPVNAPSKAFKINLTAHLTDVPQGQDQVALQKLTSAQQITLTVDHDNTPPSGLELTGLPAQVSEGSITHFQVVATVPGVDENSGEKPHLQYWFDATTKSSTSGILEMDGSRYISADVDHPEAEYLGHDQWKFYRIFDTKNNSVQPPKSVTGAVLGDDDTTEVRFVIKVYSPFNSATLPTVQETKILLNRAVTAPHFDLSALHAEALVLTPGQTTKLAFAVATSDQAAQLKLELPDLKNLPGSPQLNCAVSPKSDSEQNCQLQWKVPCSAKAEDLTQEIKMTATAESSGRNSTPVEQDLKTQWSSKISKSCPKNSPAFAKPVSQNQANKAPSQMSAQQESNK